MSDELARKMVAARKAIQALMKHKTARLLFNAPVELPGYTDVVEQPMDLGTVLSGLQESEKEGWGAGATFPSPEAVHDAVQLIWDNCSQFNKSNQPVLDLCSQLKAAFEEKWQAAGLMGGGQAPADDVGPQPEPPAAAMRTRQPSQRKSARSAVKQDSDSEPEAQASRPSSSSKRRRPQGHAAAKSSAKSAGRQAATSRKGKAAAGDPDALSLDEDEDADALAEAELAAAEAAEAAEEAEPDEELGHGRGRKRKRTFRQAALQVDEMDYADEEPDFDPEEEAREAAAKKAPKVPLEGWGKLERGHGPADEEASEPEDEAEPEVEPSDDPEREARHRVQERAARARQQHEAERARGPPPEPCRDFRLPMHLVPQLLMVWELSQMLGYLLQIPAFPFLRLEAAIAPGPQQAWHQEMEQAVDSPGYTPEETPTSRKQGRPRKDAGVAQQPPPQVPLAPAHIDMQGIASAVVLRDVHCALLKGALGRGFNTMGAPRPQAARLQGDGKDDAKDWMLHVSSALLGSTEPLDAAAKAAALRLAFSDYLDLSLEERVSILRGLADMVLGQEVVADWVWRCIEGMGPPKRKQVQIAAHGKEEALGATAEAEPPVQSSTEGYAGSPEAWAKWLEDCNVGFRKSLGTDVQGRRYWGLGPLAGAWRVYVQGADGSQWGWYDGPAIAELLTWLRAGQVPQEQPLIIVLERAPLPRRSGAVEDDAVPHVSTDVDSAWPLVPAPELELQRPDGFAGLVAPMLRGEGNWPHASLPQPLETRILHAADALLGAIPFGWKDAAQLREQADLHDALAAAHMLPDIGAALQRVEALLGACSLLDSEWLQRWQPAWRATLGQCQQLRDTVMHLAALQAHVVWHWDRLPRAAFQRLVTPTKCQLWIPFPGEQVVLLRSGLLKHIDTDMKALRLSPQDSTAAEAAEVPVADGNSAEPSEAQSEPGQAEASAGTQGQAAVSTAASGPESVADGDAAAEVSQPRRGRGRPFQRRAPTWVDWHGPIAAKDLPQVRQQWASLRERAAALRPVERYRVVTVAYTRSLVSSRPEDRGDILTGAQPRRPVAWLLLRPSHLGVPHQLPSQDLAVPICMDIMLPDFIVKQDAYDRGMTRLWQEGNRFRMLFANNSNARAGGKYHRGTIRKMQQPMPGPGASLEEHVNYDPFEALAVEWDRQGHSTDTSHDLVGTWEIENDPEEEKRVEEERRKADAESARVARLEAKARRQGGDGPRGEDASRCGTPAQQPQPSGLVWSKPQTLAALHQPPSGQLQGSGDLNKAASRSAASTGAELGPLDLGPRRPISQEVLASLRTLMPEALRMMVANFNRRTAGRFKTPMFAHSELDLARAFWAVQDKGGYDAVCAGKLWKEVCRCMEVDLTGQTSASFNLRTNYDKIMLTFEHYLASPAYARDLLSGTAPATDMLEPLATRQVVTRQRGGRGPGRPARMANGERQDYAELAGLMEEADLQQPSQDHLGSTDLVTEDAGAQVEACGAPDPEPPAKRKRGRPPGRGKKSQGLTRPPGNEPIGVQLWRLGAGLVGRKVMRYWPDEGGWWEAEVKEASPRMAKFRLMYNEGTEDESFEWIDFRELAPTELRIDWALPKQFARNPSEMPVPTLVGFLRAGISPQELHSMVDQAAASLNPGAPSVEPPSLQPLPAGTGVDGSALHMFMQDDSHTAAAEAVARERGGHQGTHGGGGVAVGPARTSTVKVRIRLPGADRYGPEQAGVTAAGGASPHPHGPAQEAGTQVPAPQQGESFDPAAVPGADPGPAFLKRRATDSAGRPASQKPKSKLPLPDPVATLNST